MTNMCKTQTVLTFLVEISLFSDAVLRIRIHRFLGITDPDSLVRGTDPAQDADPSIIMQK
jgi:hypothetical protein